MRLRLRFSSWIPAVIALCVLVGPVAASGQVVGPLADGSTPLHLAARDGALDTIRDLLGRGADVSAVNRYGISALWLAAENGHPSVTEALLGAGADPNATRGASGETALMIAARNGQVEVMRVLLAHGANVNAQEAIRMQTALMWAAAEQHAAAVRVLTEAGADPKARSVTGMTALMFALRSGDLESTRGLVEAGADLTETTKDGTTMLVLAILNAHYELAAFLLERGADPNRDDPHGRPLHVLTWMRRAEGAGLASELPRRASGSLDTLEFAKLLLAKGAKVNDRIDWKDPGGVSRLYQDFVFSSRPRPVRIPQNMAISGFQQLSIVGATPFYIAAMNCDVPFMKFLAANGADPMLSTIQGVTPLMAAAGVGISIGASPGTPEEALDAVKLAYSLGNDPKAVVKFGDYQVGTDGWDGTTALHGAVIRGAGELVEWLIETGAPIDHKNKYGETPLDLAEGSSLGINLHVQFDVIPILRRRMTEQGLVIPPPRDPLAAEAPGRR